MSTEVSNTQAQQPDIPKLEKGNEITPAHTKEEPKNGRWYLPALVFLLVPSLYAIGIVYWESWLQAHSLTATVFPLNFDQAVFKGYEAVVLLLMSWMLPYLSKVTAIVGALLILWAIAAALILLWGLLAASLLALLSFAFQRLRTFLMAYEPVVRIIGKAYLFASVPFLAAGAVVYFFILLIVPIIIGQYAGKQMGQKSLEEVQERIKIEKFKAGDQFITLSEGSDAPLMVIACGPYGCGVASQKSTMFVTWDHVAKIETYTSTDLKDRDADYHPDEPRQ